MYLPPLDTEPLPAQRKHQKMIKIKSIWKFKEKVCARQRALAPDNSHIKISYWKLLRLKYLWRTLKLLAQWLYCEWWKILLAIVRCAFDRFQWSAYFINTISNGATERRLEVRETNHKFFLRNPLNQLRGHSSTIRIPTIHSGFTHEILDARTDFTIFISPLRKNSKKFHKYC